MVDDINSVNFNFSVFISFVCGTTWSKWLNEELNLILQCYYDSYSFIHILFALPCTKSSSLLLLYQAYHCEINVRLHLLFGLETKGTIKFNPPYSLGLNNIKMNKTGYVDHYNIPNILKLFNYTWVLVLNNPSIKKLSKNNKTKKKISSVDRILPVTKVRFVANVSLSFLSV